VEAGNNVIGSDHEPFIYPRLWEWCQFRESALGYARQGADGERQPFGVGSHAKARLSTAFVKINPASVTAMAAADIRPNRNDTETK
jgi:hypothetical protein